ncbi:hypothetical protein FXO37_31516 [Capsicum annuum]|nr:hypothetical protein FXO37_31516 [Capsicum annuum]
MAAGAGSSQPIDVVDLISSLAPLSEPPVSALVTTGGTTDLSALVTTRATNDESDGRTYCDRPGGGSLGSWRYWRFVIDRKEHPKISGEGVVDTCAAQIESNSRNNVLSLDKAALVAGIMVVYEIDVAKWIARKTRDRATSTNKVMAFLCLLTQICLNAGVQELPDVDQFIIACTTKNLGLFRDNATPCPRLQEQE